MIMKKLSVIGIGPGSPEEMTPRARGEIEKAELIVGYRFYVDLIRDLFPEKEYYTTGMRGEIDRVDYAVSRAVEGDSVAVICSGDAEVYGLASLVFQIAVSRGMDLRRIEIIPGITAALSCGAVLGSPLSCDFAVISLSDHLVPWERIERRLNGAAGADLPIVLYNPGSRQRREHLRRACELIGKYKRPDTVCAVVRNAGRTGESHRILLLSELASQPVDMFTTVFIGSGDTLVYEERMITPRGYDNKYGFTEKAEDQSVSGYDEQNSQDKCLPYSPENDSGDGQPGKLLIFGGTTEGRKLAQTASEAGYSVTLSVASDYGKETAENAGERIRILSGRKTEEEICRLLIEGRYLCVIDSTHPYAQHISGSISRAASSAKVRCIRIKRETDVAGGDQMMFSDMAAVITYLNRQEGNVFFATGSNASEEYTKLRDLKDRGFIRILPSETALTKIKAAGFRSSHIICMQGPFTEEMNMACFRYADAEWLVTKASGKEGGYDAKRSAAGKLGMKILVIRPPEYQEDVQVCSFSEAELMIREQGLQDI